MSRYVRHIACLTSLLGVLLSAQGGLVAHALFELRHAYIARHLCENRFEPASHCEGMCFLKKRLAEQEHARDARSATAAASPVLFFVVEEARFDLAPSETTQPLDAYVRVPEAGGHPPEIDPPPRLV